ncbi:unnamed protein product [Didymodactylos carnosus]|uniref:Uncharacterized protein n=1 Tax=Didymodactylos carnosus TaxID=1234261 RepID=A0A815DR40_9BILA|nr:unnamed protein product [Didymodactylos carnosus]CAF1301568.1 unnamed protein product [Didymodactylos carnosus]CAF3614498.1 unnamed protein product [Didymodactylos carnosus]CAF4126753.1 unnamed protein product [Didymodactylos carnosus]
MAVCVAISSEDIIRHPLQIDNSKIVPQPTYWNAQNHSEDSYLRAEHWMEDVKECLLPGRHEIVRMNLKSGQAILRYREELKMFAAIRDEKLNSKSKKSATSKKTIQIESMQSPTFLDEHWKTTEAVWPKSPILIAKFNRSAFIKLSVRSPKDAVFCLLSTREIIRERIAASVAAGCSEINELNEDVSAIKWAAWRGLRVSSGAQAIQLLLRSDRVYVDILQHELFLQTQPSTSKEENATFNLNVIVREFFEGFHPNWEYRGFVSGGIRTGLTAYNPWILDPQQLANKDRILELISSVWTQVESKIIKISDYSIDFAVAPTCMDGQCWVIEVNAFLPPLAGSGLFSMQSPVDRNIIKNGPFEFRMRDTAVSENDFVVTETDHETGRQLKIIMQPAPPELMNIVKKLRRDLKHESSIHSPEKKNCRIC